MPELNGKTYEMQYLTDEETAVINAMRMGGKVEVHFFNSTTEAAEKHAKELASLACVNIRTLKTDQTEFDSHDIHIGKHTIYHFVDK
jgi:hypothetical protein